MDGADERSRKSVVRRGQTGIHSRALARGMELCTDTADGFPGSGTIHPSQGIVKLRGYYVRGLFHMGAPRNFT